MTPPAGGGGGGVIGLSVGGNAARHVGDDLNAKGSGQRRPANDPRNHQHDPQCANYRAPLPRQQRHEEHRPQRPTERSDPTQHAEGRTGDCPGPRKETATRRKGRGVFWHEATVLVCLPLAALFGLSPLCSLTLCGSEREGTGGGAARSCRHTPTTTTSPLATPFARSNGVRCWPSLCPLRPPWQTVPVVRSDVDGACPSATSPPGCCTGCQHCNGCH